MFLSARRQERTGAAPPVNMQLFVIQSSELPCCELLPMNLAKLLCCAGMGGLSVFV
jgi:hypothetical protein